MLVRACSRSAVALEFRARSSAACMCVYVCAACVYVCVCVSRCMCVRVRMCAVRACCAACRTCMFAARACRACVHACVGVQEHTHLHTSSSVRACWRTALSSSSISCHQICPVRPSVRPSVRLSVRPSIRRFNHPTTLSPARPSARPCCFVVRMFDSSLRLTRAFRQSGLRLIGKATRNCAVGCVPESHHAVP